MLKKWNIEEIIIRYLKNNFSENFIFLMIRHNFHNAFLILLNLSLFIFFVDSTNEYINGNVEDINEFGFHSSGLHCVTINIGLFDKFSGQPVAGVINQPFFKYDTVGRY